MHSNALFAPILEVEYGLDKKNPLQLYKSLIPHLREHYKVDKLDVELENERLKLQIEMYDEHIKHMLSHQDIINWQATLTEEGIDSMTLM